MNGQKLLCDFQGSPKTILRSSESASSEISCTASSDYSTSWRKLVDTMAKSETENPDNNYSNLFMKYASDSNRSRSSSLAHVDRTPSMSIGAGDSDTIDLVADKVSESPGDDDVFPSWKVDYSMLDSIDLSELPVDIPKEPVIHPDAVFLHDMEPSASPTLRGLSHWRDVSSIDSDQLIAKSKE